MLYALLIHHAEDIWERLPKADQEKAFAAHRALQADSRGAGHFRAAVKLMPSTAATTVRRRGGEETVLDGPFPETKELLAGLYVVECETLDEALAYARRIPAAAGGIEVRPIEYLGLA